MSIEGISGNARALMSAQIHSTQCKEGNVLMKKRLLVLLILLVVLLIPVPVSAKKGSGNPNPGGPPGWGGGPQPSVVVEG